MDETPNPLLQWQEDVREIAEVLARRSGTSILEEGPEALTLYRVRLDRHPNGDEQSSCCLHCSGGVLDRPATQVLRRVGEDGVEQRERELVVAPGVTGQRWDGDGELYRAQTKSATTSFTIG